MMEPARKIQKPAMKKPAPALGRGLSALLRDAGASASVHAAPREMPIAALRVSPGQPRKRFAQKELAELAESVAARGVLQPILVRPVDDGSAEGITHEIVAGERRVRAAQKAGLHKVPVVVRTLSDTDALEIGLVENIQRDDLTPLEEARAYERLSALGRNQSDIAGSVGKSRPHVANMMRLLALPPSVCEMVEDGRLSAGHARALLGAANAASMAALARRVLSDGLNVRQTEALGARGHRRKRARLDADTHAFVRGLSESLGVPVSLLPRARGGTIRIRYRTAEQLEDIARRLRRRV